MFPEIDQRQSDIIIQRSVALSLTCRYVKTFWSCFYKTYRSFIIPQICFGSLPGQNPLSYCLNHHEAGTEEDNLLHLHGWMILRYDYRGAWSKTPSYSNHQHVILFKGKDTTQNKFWDIGIYFCSVETWRKHKRDFVLFCFSKTVAKKFRKKSDGKFLCSNCIEIWHTLSNEIITILHTTDCNIG